MSNGIYCYVDKKNNTIVYIGKDSYIHRKDRHYAHISPTKYSQQQINKVIQNTPNRYQYKTLVEGNFTKKELNNLEISYIKKYNPRFNFTKGGDGTLGRKHSDKTKKKYFNGEKNPFFGKKHTKSSIKKMRDAKLGKKHDDETKIKMSKNKNTSGYFRVSKKKTSNTNQGFIWDYNYYDEENKRRRISSIDIKTLEKKVKEKNLKWVCFNE